MADGAKGLVGREKKFLVGCDQSTAQVVSVDEVSREESVSAPASGPRGSLYEWRVFQSLSVLSSASLAELSNVAIPK
jgi:hypothetical protein